MPQLTPQALHLIRTYSHSPPLISLHPNLSTFISYYIPHTTHSTRYAPQFIMKHPTPHTSYPTFYIHTSQSPLDTSHLIYFMPQTPHSTPQTPTTHPRAYQEHMMVERGDDGEEWGKGMLPPSPKKDASNYLPFSHFLLPF